MKVKLIFLLALTALFSSCSNDEPENPIPGKPSQSEFTQKITGKTWKLNDVRFFDAAGHDFKNPLVDTQYLYPQGYLFTDSSVRCAIYPKDALRYSLDAKWQYDENSGRLYIFTASLNAESYCVVESVDDYELVIRADFGYLSQGQWEMANGEDRNPFWGWDEDSYARLTYCLLPTDFGLDKDFWNPYPLKQ